jgi:hypothetical protein
MGTTTPSPNKRHQDATDDPPMSHEELARRMLAMPAKQRDEMTGSAKKKAKPRKKKQ